MFSIFFFFIPILKRSLSFTTIYFLYNLPFNYSKHVHCFRQANVVEIYLIIFDAVVGKVGIFSLRGYKKCTNFWTSLNVTPTVDIVCLLQ